MQDPAAPDAVVQLAPSFPGVDEHPAAVQVSIVHGLPSSQVVGATGVQTPFSQLLKPVHTSPEAHCGPVNGVLKQPDAGSQPSAVHGLLSSQTGDGNETHWLFLHVCGLH
ncbi:MAG TPA: hypothetical protein VL403_08275 [Candidatus Kryptonia bacterium]|nr:hypothetical protein [Candidatus Kryptonia bacterium]